MSEDFTTLATEIVCAYVARNVLPPSELPGLINAVHSALSSLGKDLTQEQSRPYEQPSPTEIRRSVTPDALTSFIDGKPYKTLKRHLTTHGFTPETYRRAYGLPSDYPMVAANYAAQRSALAKSIGLGRPSLKAVA